MKLKFLTAIVAMSFFSNSVLSSEVKPWMSYFSWTAKDKMPALIKDARKRHQTRSFASNNADTSLMSKEYKSIRDKMLAAKTPDEVHSLILDLEKNLNNYPADAKFLGSVLTILKPFRGIVYRMIPMVEKPKITHSFLRNQVKILASNMRVYLPSEHWEAGFAYITQPYQVAEGQAVSQFKNKSSISKKNRKRAVTEFQEYIYTDIYPAMANAAKVIEGIKLEKPVVWDNKIVFGPDSFGGDITENRYRYLQEGERRLALSSLHMGMHYLQYFVSYNLEGLLSLTKDIGKLYGVDGFAFTNVEGVPSYRIVKAVSKYSDIFTIKDGAGEHMKLSFLHLQEGVRQLRLSREELRNESPNQLFLLNPARIDPWDENFEKQMVNIECVIEDSSDDSKACPVRSAITGEVVVVDLKSFYNNPPKDLKSFMPTSWDIGKKEITNKKLNVNYPNYFWGQPTAWNTSAYKTYFPEIKDGDDLKKYVRVLRQAFGGEVFGAPIAMFVE